MSGLKRRNCQGKALQAYCLLRNILTSTLFHALTSYSKSRTDNKSLKQSLKPSSIKHDRNHQADHKAAIRCLRPQHLPLPSPKAIPIHSILLTTMPSPNLFRRPLWRGHAPGKALICSCWAPPGQGEAVAGRCHPAMCTTPFPGWGCAL